MYVTNVSLAMFYFETGSSCYCSNSTCELLKLFELLLLITTQIGLVVHFSIELLPVILGNEQSPG